MSIKRIRPIIFFTIMTVIFNVPSAFGESIVFRIGTGGSAGTYFPIGSLISQAITNADLQTRNEVGQKKTVVAIAQRSNGSVANVSDIENGLLEAGLSQADVAHWTFYATGPFSDMKPKKSIRTIASLYSESIHLVARKDSGIKSIDDLVGRKVSIDEFGSGTLFDVKLVLSAFGIELDDIEPVYLKPNDAIERFKNDTLDAFILVAGYPVQQVVDLAYEELATIIPIDGPVVEKLVNEHSFFSTDTVPAGTYKNSSDINTLSVSAQFIVNANLSDEMVYQISKTLWSKETRTRLGKGHPIGKAISLENAIKGVSIPLHPGAIRFYNEMNMVVKKLSNSE